jgi:hypothetical protein
MDLSVKLAILKERLNKLENSQKNVKCPGVKKKLTRQVRNMESKLAEV